MGCSGESRGGQGSIVDKSLVWESPSVALKRGASRLQTKQTGGLQHLLSALLYHENVKFPYVLIGLNER